MSTQRTEEAKSLRASLASDIEHCRGFGQSGYVYGYPHKKAYRPLAGPRLLTDVWRQEDRGHLYCYVHLPFCNQRCSFCNLFTFVPDAPPALAYLDALAREMDSCAEAFTPFSVARLYLGGGTPTFLATAELRLLARRLRESLGVDPARTAGCIEASPETLDAEKVGALREMGFQRLSLGVQSFNEDELRRVNRRFDFALHDRAIDLVSRADFSHFNLDLIYGLPGQTLASWGRSLERAIDTPATSLFLYPLYIRPHTGLSRRSLLEEASPTTRQMAAMYDFAVDRLSNAGFRQVTMRQFRRDQGADDEYDCTRDGMVGLGAGARSYTSALHYSTPWKMIARNIRSVVEEYVARMRSGDTQVSHGFALDDDERQRRWVIQTLLYDGVDVGEFARRFGPDIRVRFAEVWEALLDEDCIVDGGSTIRLTEKGVRNVDVVGRLFFSPRVCELVAAYEYDT